MLVSRLMIAIILTLYVVQPSISSRACDVGCDAIALVCYSMSGEYNILLEFLVLLFPRNSFKRNRNNHSPPLVPNYGEILTGTFYLSEAHLPIQNILSLFANLNSLNFIQCVFENLKITYIIHVF